MIAKIALATALTLGTIVAASASEFDGNLLNRYPQATHTYQSKNVGLSGSNGVLIHNESYIDRASQSFGGGY
jgi:hypothetical protein